MNAPEDVEEPAITVSRLVRFGRRFVAPSLLDGPQERRALAETIAAASLVGILTFTAGVGVVLLTRQSLVMASILAVGAVTFPVVLILLKRGAPLAVASHVLMGILCVGLLSLTALSGGANVGALFANVLIPVFGGICAERRVAVAWTSVACLTIAVVLALFLAGVRFPMAPDPAKVAVAKFFAALIVIIAAARAMQVYENVRKTSSHEQQRREEVESQLTQLREREHQSLNEEIDRLRLLSGGVAHDFNNLLQIIRANAEVAQILPDGGHPEDPVLQKLRAIVQASDNAADIVSQLSAYAGRRPPDCRPTELTELLREIVLTIDPSRGAPATLDEPNEPRWADVEPTQIRRVVLNLITNAQESSRDGGGAVVVRCTQGNIDSETLSRCQVGARTAPGEFVTIEVTDNGCGIAPEALSRIFDPFFTSKSNGGGLGLAAVAGIARDHQGAVFVESQPGEGSLFRIHLPAVDLRRSRLS